MKTSFLVIGKTTEDYLKEGMSIYEKRLKNYISFESRLIPEIKNTANLSFDQQKNMEGKLLLNALSPADTIVLLDENGKNFSSTEFAQFLQKHMLQSTKSMVFVIGGPYGFSKEMYARANDKISLSRMTFSHQMVRLIFLEQLYRAMTILKNEPYHH
ncbi:MAG: 23S rRNA (pseudouridine(1915)-N(3))-methyltransferase RlmH [Bacteroidota bacterium]|nr:23S rRNA (pseudouridine(1915)-N(3))-methyltransferase RlmH [Bacteroidota bacterium]